VISIRTDLRRVHDLDPSAGVVPPPYPVRSEAREAALGTLYQQMCQRV
jgi:hypothetical protein